MTPNRHHRQGGVGFCRCKTTHSSFRIMTGYGTLAWAAALVRRRGAAGATTSCRDQILWVSTIARASKIDMGVNVPRLTTSPRTQDRAAVKGRVDVVIVGGGPFGLMLANEPGRRGITAKGFHSIQSTGECDPSADNGALSPASERFVGIPLELIAPREVSAFCLDSRTENCLPPRPARNMQIHHSSR